MSDHKRVSRKYDMKAQGLRFAKHAFGAILKGVITPPVSSLHDEKQVLLYHPYDSTYFQEKYPNKNGGRRLQPCADLFYYALHALLAGCYSRGRPELVL